MSEVLDGDTVPFTAIPFIAIPGAAIPGIVSEAASPWGAARALILDNPDLVHDDLQLLQALGLRPAAANVIEFGPAALARLEAARAREITARESVEALARANHDAQTQVHGLALDLLGARNPADLAAVLNEGAQRRFGLEAAAIGIEGRAPAGWRTLPPGLLSHVLGYDAGYAVGPCTGGREIFAEAADRVRSVALVRIAVFDPPRQGVLAFGAGDPEHFSSEMGVELIAFVARVVERMADRWPPVA